MVLEALRHGGHVAHVSLHSNSVELPIDSLRISNSTITRGLFKTNTAAMVPALVAPQSSRSTGF